MRRAIGRVRVEVDQHQPAAWLEHAPHFTEAGPLHIRRQVVKHEARQDDIEGAVAEAEALDHAKLEGRAAPSPGRFESRDADHRRPRVDADRCALRPDRLGGEARQHARATTNVEHPIAPLEPGERKGATPHGQAQAHHPAHLVVDGREPVDGDATGLRHGTDDERRPTQGLDHAPDESERTEHQDDQQDRRPELPAEPNENDSCETDGRDEAQEHPPPPGAPALRAGQRRSGLRVGVHGHTATLTRFRSAELTITESELRAIAAAAMIGLR